MAPKRGAAASGRSPKRARADPQAAQVRKALAKVEGALDDRQVDIDGSKFNRKMLVAAIGGALGLGASADERHQHQKLLVGYMAEVLNADKKKHEQAVAASQAELDEVTKAKDACDASVGAAQAELDAKKADVSAKKDTVREDKTAIKTAEKTVHDTAHAVDHFDEIQKKKGKELDSCKAALSVSFDAVKKAEWANKADKRKGESKHFAAIESALEAAGASDTLVKSFTSALELAPDARGSFDAQTIKFVEQKLSAHIADLTKGLSDGPGLKSQKEGEAAQAKAALEACTAKHTASTEALSAAEAEVGDLNAKLIASKANSKDALKKVNVKSDALKDQQAELDNSSSALDSFNYLVDRPAVLPEPEPVVADAAQEPAVAEEAA